MSSYADSVINPEDSARYEALEAFADLLDDMLEMVAENPEDSSVLQDVITAAQWNARNEAYKLTGAYQDDRRNRAQFSETYVGE